MPASWLTRPSTVLPFSALLHPVVSPPVVFGMPLPHSKAATKLFSKITGGAPPLTPGTLSARLCAFGVPEERADRLFALIDGDGDGLVTEAEFVRGFAHYTAVVAEHTEEPAPIDLGQLPPEIIAIVLAHLPAHPAEVTAVAQCSTALRAAAGADGVWAPLFLLQSWETPAYRALASTAAGEEWAKETAGQPAEIRRWNSWRECYLGALRQESWVVVDPGPGELRLGSVTDHAPTTHVLAGCHSLRDGLTCPEAAEELARLICSSLEGEAGATGLGLSVQGSSLAVVLSPFDLPTAALQLAEALARRGVLRLLFQVAPMAALECARPRLDLQAADSPSGVVVMLEASRCYTTAVVAGRCLHDNNEPPSEAPEAQAARVGDAMPALGQQSDYGIDALASDVAEAVGDSEADTLGIRALLADMCYVRACSSDVREVTAEERDMCHARFHLPASTAAAAALASQSDRLGRLGGAQTREEHTGGGSTITIGEERFCFCEKIVSGVMRQLVSVAELLSGGGGGGGSRTQAKELRRPVAVVSAGEGAVLQGWAQRLGWEVRQADRGSDLSRLLRGAQQIALTHPGQAPTGRRDADDAVRSTALKNGGDHSFGSRFRPLRNHPPVFWCHFLESWLQDGENR
eukprot:COSAG04_NODE_474_length_13783_cov_18.185691_1_plen_633_part_10